jgi:hypothetical protein
MQVDIVSGGTNNSLLPYIIYPDGTVQLGTYLDAPFISPVVFDPMVVNDPPFGTYHIGVYNYARFGDPINGVLSVSVDNSAITGTPGDPIDFDAVPFFLDTNPADAIQVDVSYTYIVPPV